MWRKRRETKSRQDNDLAAEMAAGDRALMAQIAQLEGRLEKLEKAWIEVDHSWTEWYDKFRRLHMRLAKRDQRAEDAPGSTNGGSARVQVTNPAALALLQRGR